MNNLIQNYELILRELTKICSHITSFKQIRQPKLSDLELVALNLTAEYMSYNSEMQLFRAIKGTYLDAKIERSVYNKRRRKLFDYTEKIRQRLSEKFSHLSNLFIIDSTPIEICKISRAKRSSICSTENIKPEFGYCAATKTHYFGYKLHAICDENAVVHSFDFTPANVHDVNYLKDVKYTLSSCELIGDKGYISADYQADLFNQSQIKLSVPTRNNQLVRVELSKPKRRKRKRIETLFSQFKGQFSMNTNFAKTFGGLATRILSKITALTMIQYLNLFLFNRNMNCIKINIC
ncbi:hypothetical protein EZS27_024829 [termite gut metagenome]|uniref:Transposase IS4-like domain-containing protein n=1 Tax=termite gut metagenome TaxID=433724 RepID=A0A5J4QXN2_9ZZZZ